MGFEVCCVVCACVLMPDPCRRTWIQSKCGFVIPRHLHYIELWLQSLLPSNCLQVVHIYRDSRKQTKVTVKDVEKVAQRQRYNEQLVLKLDLTEELNQVCVLQLMPFHSQSVRSLSHSYRLIPGSPQQSTQDGLPRIGFKCRLNEVDNNLLVCEIALHGLTDHGPEQCIPCSTYTG